MAYLTSLHFHDHTGLSTFILEESTSFRLGCLEGLAVNSSCYDFDHDLADLSALIINKRGGWLPQCW